MGATRFALLLALGCGYHDTPVATYRAPLPEPESRGSEGGAAGAAGETAAGAPQAGASSGAGGEAGRAEPACLTTYSLVVPGLSSRYKQATTGAPWVDAARDCEADGAHLVVVSDQAENDWLKSLAELAVTDDASTNQLLWLGLSDHAKEGEFVWITGAPVTDARGAASEPNSWNGTEDRAELRASGEWNDDRCNAPLTYVCECDGQPSAGVWCDTTLNATCGDCSTHCPADLSCTNQSCQ